MNKIIELLALVEQNKENPDALSGLLLKISNMFYYHNSEMASAEYREKAAAIDALNNKRAGDKRLSVSEAEKIAVVKTNNEYGVMKAQTEAIKEVINSIKVRIKVLSWEIEKGGDSL